MEYYLGTIHWLDALTPPLERHLQRLAQTVKSCLHGEHSDDDVPTRSGTGGRIASNASAPSAIQAPADGVRHASQLRRLAGLAVICLLIAAGGGAAFFHLKLPPGANTNPPATRADSPAPQTIAEPSPQQAIVAPAAQQTAVAPAEPVGVPPVAPRAATMPAEQQAVIPPAAPQTVVPSAAPPLAHPGSTIVDNSHAPPGKVIAGGVTTCGKNGCQFVPNNCHAVTGAGGHGLGGKIFCP